MNKIDICLNYFKFHSFNYKKGIHNEWNKSKNNSIKCEKDILDKIILSDFKKNIDHIKTYDNINNLKCDFKRSKNGNSYHKIDYKYKDLIIDIIKTCHKNLYSDLNQRFEGTPINDLSFYQIPINKKSRIMVIIDNNNIIPLIIDLNHCIYNTKINYDKNIGKSYKWDFKSHKKTLKINY